MVGIQRKIARAAGVSDAFIAMILAGKKRPSWEKAKRIGEFTGTEPSFWLEGSAEKMRAFVNNLEIEGAAE